MNIQRTNGAYGGGNATGMVNGSEEGAVRRGRAGAAPAAAARGDTVNVSQNGHLLSVARSVAHNAPDTRADKVARLREQVENGTYVADSRRIAAAIAREEPGLFKLA